MSKPRTCPRLDLVMSTDLVEAALAVDSNAPTFYLDDLVETAVLSAAKWSRVVCLIGYCHDIYSPQRQVDLLLSALHLVVKHKLAARLYSNNLLHLYAINNCLELHNQTKRHGVARPPLPLSFKRYVALEPRWVRYTWLDLPNAKLVWKRATSALIDESVLGNVADQLGVDFSTLLCLNSKYKASSATATSIRAGLKKGVKK